MLVLTRYKDETIYIGDDITVTIVDVRGDRVKLGVEAPQNISVHREEVYNEIHNKNRNKKVVKRSKKDNPSNVCHDGIHRDKIYYCKESKEIVIVKRSEKDSPSNMCHDSRDDDQFDLECDY